MVAVSKIRKRGEALGAELEQRVQEWLAQPEARPLRSITLAAQAAIMLLGVDPPTARAGSSACLADHRRLHLSRCGSGLMGHLNFCQSQGHSNRPLICLVRVACWLPNNKCVMLAWYC